MKFKSLLENKVVPSKIEDLSGRDEVISYLNKFEIDYRTESINNKKILIIGSRQHIVEFEGEYPVVYELERFLREKTNSRNFSDFTGIDWRRYYTQQFWDNVGKIHEFNELYHATEKQYVDDILENGLKATNQTRIPTLKIRKRAVFAVKDVGFLQDGTYGEETLAIDMIKMKNDGNTPPVGREKDWERQDRALFLKNELNIYGQIQQMFPAGQRGTGSWRDTVVIYSDVPAKYISLV